MVYLSERVRKWPVQKETNTATMDTKAELRPIRSLSGKFLSKSSTCFRSMSIERNKMSAVTEK